MTIRIPEIQWINSLKHHFLAFRQYVSFSYLSTTRVLVQMTTDRKLTRRKQR